MFWGRGHVKEEGHVEGRGHVEGKGTCSEGTGC